MGQGGARRSRDSWGPTVSDGTVGSETISILKFAKFVRLSDATPRALPLAGRSCSSLLGDCGSGTVGCIVAWEHSQVSRAEFGRLHHIVALQPSMGICDGRSVGGRMHCCVLTLLRSTERCGRFQTAAALQHSMGICDGGSTGGWMPCCAMTLHRSTERCVGYLRPQRLTDTAWAFATAGRTHARCMAL